jgi:hypothetical protein
MGMGMGVGVGVGSCMPDRRVPIAFILRTLPAFSTKWF